MAIWRGVGGSGDATTDAGNEASAAVTAANNAAASATAAASSATTASTSATNAATSETNASTSATNAASSATSASSSASTATTQASNASTSATSAASSASAASTSATNAANSATAAASSETNAATSETNAATSETNAASSASTASSSATSAASSATAAASSASSASTSASNASTSETNAGTSATNAANSATNAASSATAAASSASAASTSASNASTSETNAATSESNASTSASNASTSATNAANSATSAASSATSAAASYDSFDDRYLGAKSSAPTLDNDGDALLTGALYYNTTTSQLYIWTGSAWDNAAFSTSGSVTSFNTRTGAVTLTSSDVNTALGSDAVLDSDIGVSVQAYSSVLAGTTASFTTTDETKLDGIEALADVTDTTNVTAAGALMDSELTSEASVKALNQGVATTDSPSFAGLTVDTNTLYVDSTNNKVGVGTSSPSGKLHVNGGDLKIQDATPNIYLNSEGAVNYVQILANITDSVAGGISIYENANQLISSRTNYTQFFTANTERVRIDSSGNVGIGTTSTSNAGLSVVSAKTFSTAFVKCSDTTGAAGVFVQNDNNTGDCFMYAFNSAGTPDAAVGTSKAQSLKLYTNNSARVTVDSTGKVGIGTTSPSYDLEINDASDPTIRLYDTRGGTQPDVRILSHGTTGVGRIGTYSAKDFALMTNSTECMRITSTGYVGIGTSSPSYHLDIQSTTGSSQIRVKTTNVGSSAIVQVDGGGSTSYPGFHLKQGGTHYWSIQQRGNTNLHLYRESGSGNVVIDQANVGIGTTSPTAQLQVFAQDSAAGKAIRAAYDGTYYSDFTESGIHCYNNLFTIDTKQAQALVFGTNATERMRIDSSGKVSLGNTSSDGWLQIKNNNQSDVLITTNDTSGSGGAAMRFKVNNTTVGSISNNTTTTFYNTSSDYRLKENVVEVTDGIDRVKLLKPSRFNFIVDPDKTVDGFLAHEVADVVPEAITGTKDAVDADGNPEYQGIDQSKLVPLLTAALQEAITKIESLEARVATLESA